MKIAFVGKGGSGKTTLASLFLRHLGTQNKPTVAIDADINQHLAAALGINENEAAKIRPLGAHLDELKEYLRGNNPRISSGGTMTKTTPAGHGSQLLRVNGVDPYHQEFTVDIAGVKLMAVGEFEEKDLGIACYHSKIAAAEMYLNHVIDGPDEYIVMDMTAGADAFASGLFTRFDVTYLVAEPTLKGVGVYHQYKQYASKHDVNIKVIGNKIKRPTDIPFLHEHVGDDLLVCVSDSAYVSAREQGDNPDFSTLEPNNRDALQAMLDEVEGTKQDWEKFTRQSAEFHRKNALAWANDRAGEDLTQQIDPDFMMGPQFSAKI